MHGSVGASNGGGLLLWVSIGGFARLMGCLARLGCAPEARLFGCGYRRCFQGQNRCQLPPVGGEGEIPAPDGVS